MMFRRRSSTQPMSPMRFWHVSVFVLLVLGVTPSFGQEKDDHARLREGMVKSQLVARDITDAAVLMAMGKVPRHLFVPEAYRAAAYDDHPLPIGEGQTISQPYIVAYMTEALRPKPEDRVLEIGTGSGYQAAILAEIVKEVYSVEIVQVLGKRADRLLKELGYRNVHVRIGDGHKGWPEAAPFDAIIVTCAPEAIPKPLVDQLREGGRIVIPVGKEYGIQRLMLGIKKEGRIHTEETMLVRFVPMVGGER